jgi:hypothetical protein
VLLELHQKKSKVSPGIIGVLTRSETDEINLSGTKSFSNSDAAPPNF